MWCGGVALAVAVLGPALRPGSLLNLDLVVTPRLPVPSGAWALGPELPRRVPLFVPLAWASNLLGTYSLKLVLLGSIAAAAVGASRLVPRASGLGVRVTSALVYALSSFLVTRIAVGDIALVVVYALLPWAIPTLLRPASDVRRTFLWSAALGACGFGGGVFVIPIVVVGLVRQRFCRWPTVVGLVALAQLPWIVPGIAVVAGGPQLASAPAFATRASGAPGVLRVLAGEGFWQLGNQLGVGGTTAAVAGFALAALAFYGHKSLDAGWRDGAAWAAAIGLAVTLASALPGTRALYAHVVASPVGSTLREGQRLLPLYLVWMAPAAALGARRLSQRVRASWGDVVELVPALVALVVIAPALWGAGGRLDPVEFPIGWRAARTVVGDAPGTVLALPWDEYLDLDFAGDRRTLFPARDWFGGDVLASSDPELGPNRQEQADPRDASTLAVVAGLRRGVPASTALVGSGVRWIFLAHEFDWRLYASALARDAGLRSVVATSDSELFEVVAWPGAAWDARGDAVDVAAPLAPFARTSTHAPFVWDKPASAGWLRGTTATARTPEGLVVVRGAGPIWYWPAVLVLFVDACVIALAATFCLRAKRQVWYRARPGITSRSKADHAPSTARRLRDRFARVEREEVAG
jgi:hypothetical protein